MCLSKKKTKSFLIRFKCRTVRRWLCTTLAYLAHTFVHRYSVALPLRSHRLISSTINVSLTHTPVSHPFSRYGHTFASSVLFPHEQRVGCDLKIGSSKKVDACGVCGGIGESCSQPLYHWEIAPMSLCSVTCGGGKCSSLLLFFV